MMKRKISWTITIGLLICGGSIGIWFYQCNQICGPCQVCDPSQDNCYMNPIFDLGTENFGDPAVTYYDGIYYLVGTAPGHYSEGQIRMWSSPNLLNWTEIGIIYQAPLKIGDWNKMMFWAAELFVYKNEFYLSYSATPDQVMQNHRIGIAHASNITGPYSDIKNEPTFDLGMETIDQHIFADGDRVYMMYTNHNSVDSILLIELTPDLSGTIGNHTKLCERSSTESIMEAPWLYRHDGRYYLLYSANSGDTVDYKVGYYWSDSLNGSFTQGNYILSKTENIFGPGHCSVVVTPDCTEDFIIYQTKKNAQVNWERYVFMDRIIVTDDKSLRVLGPSLCSQKIPILSKIISNLK